MDKGVKILLQSLSNSCLTIRMTINMSRITIEILRNNYSKFWDGII